MNKGDKVKRGNCTVCGKKANRRRYHSGEYCCDSCYDDYEAIDKLAKIIIQGKEQ